VSRFVRSLLALVAAAGLVGACQQPVEQAVLAVNIVGANERTIAVGESIDLAANITATGGASKAISWTSGNTGIATVTSAGTVTGVATGATSITATSVIDATKSATVTVIVTETPTVVGVAITPAGDHTLAVGEALELTATVHAVAGASTAVSWSSSEEGVATVDDGTLVAVGEGEAVITATSEFDTTKTANTTVTVTAASTVISVSIGGPTAYTLEVEETVQLTATVTVTGDASQTVTWNSDHPGTATVTANGLVAAVDPGHATITATSTFDPTKGASVSVTVRPTPTGDLLWTRVIGNDAAQEAAGVAADPDGNILLALNTNSTFGFPGCGNSTLPMLAIGKFDPAGMALWYRCFLGGGGGIAADNDGNVIVTGHTTESLFDDNAGGADVFIAKLDPTGNLIWGRQFGTDAHDEGTAIATNAEGSIFVAGNTAGDLAEGRRSDIDGFLAKFGPDGTLDWIRQYGTTLVLMDVLSLDVDQEGYTVVASGGWRGSGFIRRFDPLGDETWTVHYVIYGGTYSAAFDASGNVFAAGATPHEAFGYTSIAFLEKLSPEGHTIWTRSLGPAEGSYARSVATDPSGNPVVAGLTLGSLGTSNPTAPGFLTKYDPDGNRIWAQQFHPEASSVAVDHAGNSLITGTADGNVHLLKFAP
jgi:uncharacterized protein YjdB